MKNSSFYGKDLAQIKKIFEFIQKTCEQKASEKNISLSVQAPVIYELAQGRQKSLVYVTKGNRWTDNKDSQFGIYLHSRCFDVNVSMSDLTNALYHLFCHLASYTTDYTSHNSNFEEIILATGGILGEKDPKHGYSNASASEELISAVEAKFLENTTFNFTPMEDTKEGGTKKTVKKPVFVYQHPTNKDIIIKSKTEVEIFTKTSDDTFLPYVLISNCDGNSPATQAEDFKNSELASRNPVPGARQQLLA